MMANEKRLIDANEVKKKIWYGNSDPSGMRQYASGFIDNAPTVDAVEVVRCEKCQWFNKKGFEEDNRQQAMPELDCGWCSTHHRIMQACMFCSYGGRKDND